MKSFMNILMSRVVPSAARTYRQAGKQGGIVLGKRHAEEVSRWARSVDKRTFGQRRSTMSEIKKNY